MWLQESQVSIQVPRATTGVLWSHIRGIKPQFSWKGESQGVFRVAAGSGGSLVLPRGPQGTSHGAYWKSGILSSCEVPLGIPLGSVQWRRASSPVEAGTSGFLSYSDMDLRVCLPFQTGSQSRLVLRHRSLLSSRAVKEFSGLQSSCIGDLGLFSNLQTGYQSSLCVVS